MPNSATQRYSRARQSEQNYSSPPLGKIISTYSYVYKALALLR